MLDERDGMFTDKEIERQDTVDNAIQNLMVELAPWGVDDIEWNMEYIGEIRDTIKEFLVDKLHLMTEQQFYPYRELGEDENVILEPSEPEQAKEMIVTDEQIVTAMKQVVEDLDADELAQLAGDALGGLCWYLNDGTYSFIPDINYCGGLDFTKEKKNG